MSNVQVHCEHCNKSLYRLEAGVSVTAPASVLLFTDRDPMFREGPVNPSRHEFCDWTCVRRWAQCKAVAE